jgi:glycine/D-amino acid oxidase-like deaminating enzyme
MERLQERAGRPVFLRRGLLWRDRASLGAAAGALDACSVPYTEVPADDVSRFFPGLLPNGRDALWQEDAGVVLAERMLAAQLELFTAAGGRAEFGRGVLVVETAGFGVRITYEDGAMEPFDRAVIAAGPESEFLLATLGVRMPLRPHLQQVVTFGEPGRPEVTDDLPCFVDGETETEPVIYAMPTPGLGYKVGVDRPLRAYTPEDADRTPDEEGIRIAAERMRRDIPTLPTPVVHAQVCSWTDSPDGRFVLDRVGESVVIACGDSGEGFKFSALMGEVLADMAEHREPEADIRPFSLSRFADDAGWRQHSLTLG